MPDFYHVFIGDRKVRARPLAENLVLGSFGTNIQDGKAAVWTWVAKYQVPSGNVLSFKTRREMRYAMTMTLNDAPTTAVSDDMEIRIVTYYPDGLQMKDIIFKGTYGSLKNGTKYDVDTMLTVNKDVDIQPDEWLNIEVYHATETLDVSASTFDIGTTRWTRAAY